MKNLEKYQSLILLVAIVKGILPGNIPFIESYAENLVTPFLFVMLEPLIELPIMTMITRILLLFRKRTWIDKLSVN